MIYFGTSGFSYDDWVGGFYPVGKPRREWLTFIFVNNHWRDSQYYSLIADDAGLVRLIHDGSLSYDLGIIAYRSVSKRGKSEAAYLKLDRWVGGSRSDD